MNQWTDEELVALLQASFVEHEGRADLDRARQIALDAESGPRWSRRVTIAAAAVLVLVAGGVLLLRPDPRSTPPPAVPALQPGHAGHNRAVTRHVAQQLLDRVPLPPGAVPSKVAPAFDLHGLEAHIGAADRSLMPHRWWVLPMPYGELVTWYAEHTPADVGSTGWPDPVEHEAIWWKAAAETSTYTEPYYVISYSKLPDGETGVRATVSLAARFDRTRETLVPVGRLTSATVQQTSFTHPPDRDSVAIHDPAWLRSIGSAFNATQPAPAHSLAGPCGSPTGNYRLYAVTFRWPGHELAVGFGQPLCRIGRDLTLDDRQLPQQLEDGTSLKRVLKAAIESH